MKNFLVKFKKRIEFAVATFIICVADLHAVRANASSVATESIDLGMNIVAAIPAAMAVFAFINAGIAYSQAQQEGGNAQSSAKMSNNIIAGIIAAVVAIFVVTRGKELVKSLLSS